MGREFSSILPDPRFQIVGMNAMVGPRKEPAMVPADGKPEHIEYEVETPVQPPRISNWLWRPWYAKLWWAGIAVYWSGKVCSLFSADLDQFYSNALAGFLNVVFFPPLTLIVLGLGYARARFDRGDWEFVETTHDELFRRPLIDPYTDPSNPLSGAIYRRHHRH